MSGVKDSHIGRLDKLDVMILECYKDDLNISPKAIANKVGIHYTNVYKRLKRPAMLEAVTEMKGSLIEILADAKRLAAKKIKRLVMSKSEGISLRACTELLKADLTGDTLATNQSIKFITVVNEVGVLESVAAPMTVDVIPEVRAPTKPSD